MDTLRKRTWAEISLHNLRHNYRAIRAAMPENCKFLGVVKADAYGHGALIASRLLEQEGADYLAVSCLDEAIELRDGGISMPLLILGHTPYEYTDILIEKDITQTVTCLAKAEEYSAAASSIGKDLKVHIKLDTGMSRLGYLCAGVHFEEGVDNIIYSCRLPHIQAEGVFTHFAVSDETDADSVAYTREQFALFNSVIEAVKDRGNIEFAIKHCANTGAFVNYPEMYMDMVRPGLLLYGYGDSENRLGLKPCMSLITTISTIKHYEAGTSVSYGRHFCAERHTRMAVLGIGYADGLMRILSNKCSFNLDTLKLPQRGNICMDMCMVDVSDAPDAKVGDKVEIFGEKNSILDLCDIAQTIPYELLCSVSKRVPRVYSKK